MTKTNQDRKMGAASARRQTAGSVSQRSTTVVRMNLFVLVRILFQYLERVDPSSLDLAKEVLKDCERKHNTKDSKYETLADAINERVRDAVGESHWAQARKIQKQLMINQQRKKLKAMKGSASKSSSSSAAAIRPPPRQQSSPQQQKPQGADEALEAAKTMSALARAAPTRERDATPPRSNRFNDSMMAPVDEVMGNATTNSQGQGHINQDGARQG